MPNLLDPIRPGPLERALYDRERLTPPSERWAFARWREGRGISSWSELILWWERILEDPGDEAARLGFGDWLAEQGEPSWSELIHMQVAASRGAQIDEGRVQQLTREVLDRGLGFCAPHRVRTYDLETGKRDVADPVYDLHRGCIERVAFLPKYMLGHIYNERLVPAWSALREHPVGELSVGISSWDGDPFQEEHEQWIDDILEAMGTEPAIERVLVLTFGRDGCARLAPLLSGGGWRQLHTLELRYLGSDSGQNDLSEIYPPVDCAKIFEEEDLPVLLEARSRLPSLRTLRLPMSELAPWRLARADVPRAEAFEPTLPSRVERWREQLPGLDIFVEREPVL